jgi:hypothetical protein
MAEHTPDIDALAFEWSASPVYCRRHLFKLAQCIQGISIAMPMYVMDDRLHAQDRSGTIAPSLVRRQAPPRHQLAGHLQPKAKRFWDRDLSACGRSTGTHCVSGHGRGAMKLQHRSAVVDHTDGDRESAERGAAPLRRRTGVGRHASWRSRVGCGCRVGRQDRAVTVHVRSLDAHIRCRTVFDDELRADALLYASLLEDRLW